jgi:hypothetical protein
MFFMVCYCYQKVIQRNFYVGNSLAEYVLPIALVCLVSFAGFLTFSDSLKGFVVKSMNTELSGGNKRQLTIKPMGQFSPLQSVSIRLEDGSEIKLNGYPVQLKQSLETIGTNGTTDALADTLLSIAQQLLDQNKITPDEFNKIRAVSQKGHQIAAIQRFIEDRSQTKTALSDFRSAFTYGGQSYKDPYSFIVSLDIASQVQYDAHPDNQTQFKRLTPPEQELAVSLLKTSFKPDYIGNAQYELLKTASIVQNENVLKSPILQSVFQNLVGQIGSLSQNFSGSTWSIGEGQAGNIEPSGLLKLQASRNSDNKALSICDLGHGQDNGVHCQ